MYLTPLVFSVLIIGSIALASAAVIFLVLYILEWKQRNRDIHEHRVEIANMFIEHDKKVDSLKGEVDENHDWIEMLIQKNPLITQDIKDALIKDFKEHRQSVKLPR